MKLVARAQIERVHLDEAKNRRNGSWNQKLEGHGILFEWFKRFELHSSGVY